MSTFNQGVPSVPTVLNTSNCFIYSNSASGNALSVQQLGAGNVVAFSNASGGSNVLVMNNLGQVGIGTAGPSYTLDVVGQPRFSIQPVIQSVQLGISASAVANWYRIASLGPNARAKFRIFTTGANLQEQIVVTAAWSAAFSGQPTVRIEDQSSATFAGTYPLLSGQIRTVVYVASNGTWYLEVYLGSVATAYTLFVQLIEGDALGNSVTLTNPIVAGSVPTNYTAQPVIPVNSFSVSTWGGGNSALLIDYTGRVGIGMVPGTGTNVGKFSSANDVTLIAGNYAGDVAAQIMAVGATNTNKRLALMYDTTNNIGLVQAMIYGTGPSSLCLNAAGGNVGIGITNPGSTLTVNGSLSKSSGTFDIPHPTLPEPKRLVHSFIEGPRCDLMYRGFVALVNGTATVNIDSDCTSNAAHTMTQGTFEALCTNPVCFLQNDDSFDRVKGKVSGNLLTITCENTQSSDVVNWMVVAERKDLFIKQWNRTDPNGFLIPEYDSAS